MKKKKIYRDRLVKVYLTGEEYNLFEANFKATTFRVLSDYHRALLFGKPVGLHYRNRSLDEFLDVAGGIKVRLDAIDRNWARAIKELRERPPTAEGTGTLDFLLSEELAVREMLEDIKSTLLKMYENESQNKNVRGHE
jgi:hypothetical protein